MRGRSAWNPDGGAQRSLRMRNEMALLHALLGAEEADGLTRSELARRTGLSPATVSNLVQGHLGRFLSTATAGQGARTGRSGPKPDNLKLRGEAGYVLGVDFGRAYMSAVLCDVHGVPLEGHEFRRCPVESDAAGSLEWMAGAAIRLLGQIDHDLERLVGVGVGIAGPVNVNVSHGAGVLREDLVMPDWEGISPARELQKMLGWSRTFLVDNDANLAALAEQRWGAARGISDAIFVKWTHGIGAALIVDGELRRGVGGIAGELGHCAVELDAEHRASPPHTCSRCQRHCVESVASVPAMLRDAGIDPDAGAEALFAAANAGDTAALRAIHRAAKYLGQALGAALDLLNPEAILIGGDFKANTYRLFRAGLVSAMRERSLRSAFKDMRLVPAAMTGRATVMGAVALVLQQELMPYLIAPT